MKKQRFWEIDFLRGIALIRILIFNWSFTLMFLKIYKFDLGMIFPGIGAAVFIFLSGLSLTISYSRVRHKKPKEIYKKYFSRGLRIFGYGLLITVATFILVPDYFIVLGILHFIGISVMLGQFFLKFDRLNLILGILFIVLGLYLFNFTFDFPWLFWLGFLPKGFYSLDYFPLFPWFGITLLGIYTGNIYYRDGRRRFNIIDISNSSIVRFLTSLGRKTLFVYLIHQPVLLLVLFALGLI